MESIIAIDAGTTTSRTIAFNKKIQQLAISQFEFTQIFPKKSWVEHDPNEIWKTQLKAVKEVFENDYDVVYGSTIFQFSEKKQQTFLDEFPNAVIGGTGTDNKIRIEDIINLHLMIML